MPKTIVYVDGQNFMYSVAANLIKAGIVSDKQEIFGIDIPFLLQTIMPEILADNIEIRYYGVSRIKRQDNLGKNMLEKSIKFAENLRRLKNYLAKSGVIYIPCGQLRPRGVEKCKKCGFEDYKFQEKGVDVGIAVDIVRDVMSKKVDHVVIVSSDTDLIPAIRIAKAEGAKITYICFDKMIIRPLSVLSESTITVRAHEIAEAYARALK